VLLPSCGSAPKWDRMKIEREALGLGKQRGSQGGDPSRA
jgi:hypothetical protein